MRPLLATATLFMFAAAATTAAAQGPVTSPYLRGVPTGTATAEPLQLSYADTLQRALEHNLGVVLADANITEARGARLKALADLLPNVSGRVSATRQVVNLKAFGFPLPAGFPPIVGPFNVFDARIFLTQSIYDAQEINEARAETHNLGAARLDYRNARDLIVLIAGNMYSQALTGAALAEAARAQLETAEALHTQAQHLKDAGLAAGIDVLRADVQLATARQRVTASDADFEKTKLQLSRMIGLPLGQPFALSDQIRAVAFPDITFEQAVDRATKSRPDYQAALERVRAAEASRRAIVGELLPSVRLTADYGDIGLSASDSHSSYNVTGAVVIPIFQGGRTQGRLLQADADLKNRRAEADDLKGAIYYDIQSVFLDLRAGHEQLEVATRARELAAAGLTQARDRFAAGVSGNIEVIQAQEAVAVASDQYIRALYTSNLATGNLVRALGGAEDILRQLLGGR